ncbi:isocitrate/isopropylmalate dehydrogenase family protein [uncultured Ruegeria sp.]|uniref:isocitrate/isopropylmalate dehydrogenase family protein n=1 Tax=uncultured Ruegeria sp. TaxID=259304 RepID=UPI0026208492|nr:isocitrate/isopropylmalate dehydrogenase family protein [uncultured Ruegeria sp.]
MKIALFTGDGIGPEISAATNNVLITVRDQLGLNLEISAQPVGLSELDRYGTTAPASVWDLVKNCDGAILAPLSTYAYPKPEDGGVNLSSEFRTKLNLSSNVRPCVSLCDVGQAMDLVVVRENTEGFYAVRTMFQGAGEFMPDADSAFAIRKITRVATRRVAQTAFELAAERRKKVSVIHKANVLKLSDGLFLDEVRQVAKQYPAIELEEVLVDAAASLLVREPSSFDVVLTSNMFGDILSNLTAELSGGLGLGPSLNIGENFAVAQASHGSAPDIAGQNIANPVALTLSAAMLLDWYGNQPSAFRKPYLMAASTIRSAVREVLARTSSRTRDMGGSTSTTDFSQSVCNAIPSLLASA